MINRDALHIELKELANQLDGISPKLALYQTISERIKQIENELYLSTGWI